MASLVIMPRQGQSVESCIITKWDKQVGDSVKAGDILFSYETDKASFEEEAKEDGTLLAIIHQEQDDVPCLDPVAVIGTEGEDISELLSQAGGNNESITSDEEKTEDINNTDTATEIPVISTADISTGSGFASPRARSTASRMKVALSEITPTGPNGRIIERDVLSQGRTAVTPENKPHTISPAAEAIPEYVDEPLSNLRKIIGKSMHSSLQSMAQLTHHSSFDATNMIALRKQLKAAAEGMELPNITYNDILMYAVSRILLKHPALNAHYLSDKMRYFKHVNLGMAVDTERGLLVPTIFNADTKSLSEISKEAKQLAREAQGGSINPDYLTGASFTVSNLGSLDIEMFTPVINPPQTGILGVDCMVDRVRKTKDGFDVYSAMGISLTYDHRALDGAPASRFLKDLKTAMENITAILAL